MTATGSQKERIVNTYRRFIVATSLSVVMMPSLAAAQPSSAGTPSGLLPVAVGQKVSVTTADGKTIRGHVFGISPTTLDIGQGGVVTTSLATADVRRVQVPDSVANGVWTGALTLGLAGAVWGLLGDATSDLASGIFTGKSAGTNYTLIGTLAGASVGALLGYALDSSKVATIYQRDTAGTSVAVRPIVSDAGKGVGVSVRW